MCTYVKRAKTMCVAGGSRRLLLGDSLPSV